MPRDWPAIFKAAAPKADPRFVAAFSKIADAEFDKRAWATDRAIGLVLGHMAVESGGFRTFTENMNYKAARICAVWPSRFHSVAEAAPYAGNPEKLANRVYANRMGNGPPESGDGYRNRGCGALQHTGQNERERVKRRTGEEMEALRDAARAAAILEAALTYLEDRKVTEALKVGDLTGSTQRINGGLTGLEDRRIWTERFKVALAANGRVPAPKTQPTRAEARDKADAQGKAATGGAAASGAASAATGTVQQSKPDPALPAQPKGYVAAYAATAILLVATLLIGFVAYRLFRKAEGLAVDEAKDRDAIADARAAAPVA